MLWVLGFSVAAIGAYIAAWQWDLLPRREVATGTVQLADGKVLKTRQFLRSARRQTHKSPAPGTLEQTAAWEIELPSGRWIDCDGADCKGPAERAIGRSTGP